MSECLAIVGVGLIGGSIALAARRGGQYAPILGVGRGAATLEKCRRAGIIDEGTTDLTAAACRADVLVVCTPVDQIAPQVIAAAHVCKRETLITDAGSTKQAIVDAVADALPATPLFIGSHPLAGSEKRGPEHARADLFDNRLTIVTPSPGTPPAVEVRASAFWQSLGSWVRSMSPAQHDRILARTSHLPHLVAAAMARSLPPELREFTASGFRDTTRIAASDPQLWCAILRQNAGQIASALAELKLRLNDFESALAAGDTETLERLLTEAKKVRDDLGS